MIEPIVVDEIIFSDEEKATTRETPIFHYYLLLYDYLPFVRCTSASVFFLVRAYHHPLCMVVVYRKLKELYDPVVELKTEVDEDVF